MTARIFTTFDRINKLGESKMKTAVIYIHGKGGNASESEHYKPLFPEWEVIGLDYKSFTPWETGKEIHAAVENLKTQYHHIFWLFHEKRLILYCK